MEQQTSFTFVDMETLKSENECNQNFTMECEGISDTESNILISKNELDDENLNTKETIPVVIESVTFSSENSIGLPDNKSDYEENKDLIPSQIKSEFSNFGENPNNNGGDNDNDDKTGVNKFIEEHPIIVPVKLINTEETSSSNKSNNMESQLKENTEVEDVYINDNNLFLINNEQLNDENKNYMYLKNEEDNENKDNIDLLVMKEEKPLNNCNDISSDDVNEKVLEIGNDAVFVEEINETKYSDTTASSIKKRGRGRPRVLFKKTHPCSICHKVFSRKTHLTTHLRIHSDEKPYMCNLCCKRFRDNSVLIKHVRVHTQDKPYACLVCGKAFNQKGNMERHARQHTNEKPFICSVCGNAFNNKSHLQRHFRIHIDEKPFTCELCDKSFRQKSHLMRHVLVHSREKPYSCNLCNKRFRQEQHVTRHKKTHIKEIITGILLKQCISNPIPAEYI